MQPRTRKRRLAIAALSWLLLALVWFTGREAPPQAPARATVPQIVSHAPVGGSVNMGLTRTKAGMMAKRIANDPVVPFVAAEFLANSGTTLSLDGGGNLSLATVATINWTGAISQNGRGAQATWPKRMVQIVAQINAGDWIGPAVAGTSASNATKMAAAASVESPSRVLLQSVSNAVSTNHVLTATAVNKSTGTDYRVSAFHNGSSLSGYDFDSNTAFGPTTGNRSAGFAGISTARNGQTVLVSEFYDMADRYVYVSGLSAGRIAKVRNGGGTALSSATESGGVAAVDLMQVDISAAADVAVYEPDGTTLVEVGTPEDGVVAGGDEWRLFPDDEFPEVDGVWSWWSDPRAVYSATYNKTYFGVTKWNGDQAVYSYDHATGEIAGTVLAPDFEIDDHDPPALLIRDDGKIQAFWSAHNGTLIYHRKTTVAGDVTAWDSLQTISPAAGGTLTYPSPLKLTDGTIRLHWRELIGGTTNKRYYAQSTDDGDTFGAGVKMTDTESPYLKFAVHPTIANRIDYFISDNHPVTADPNLLHFYSVGSSSPTWHKSDGSSAGSLPLDVTSTDMTVVWNASVQGDGGWQWDIAHDADGNPVVLFATFTSNSNHRLRYGRWTGSAWTVTEIRGIGGTIAESTTPQAENQYSAGGALDPVDPTRVWVSVQSSGTVSSLWEYFTEDNGATFTGVERTNGTTTENVRPYVPRDRDNSLAVLFVRGNYPNYTTYETRIAGLRAGTPPVPGATPGDTPDVTLVVKGQDFIEVEIDPYNHPDGEVDGVANFDPDDPKPYLATSTIQIEFQADGDWNDPIDGVELPYDGTTASRRYRFEGLAPGTAYKFRGLQTDGFLGVDTAYSADLNVTTDAIPADLPNEPTIDDVICGRDITIEGDAFTHETTGTHAGTRVRICYANRCQVVTYSSPLTSVTLTGMPPGAVSLEIAYQDNFGAWGPYSDPEPCNVPDRPPVPVFTAPAYGEAISASTNVTWEVYDPNAVGWTFDIALSSDGVNFTTLATDQASASYLFSIVGKPNGTYYLGVRSRNPTTDETGEQAVLPIELDRTGLRALHVHFADYADDAAMLADGWRQIWDGPEHITFSLRDEFDPDEEETFRIGLEAKRVHAGSTKRLSGLINDAWGQPDEFDLTVAFECIPGGCDWYPYRFQNPNPTRGGTMCFGTHEGSERTGRMDVMTWEFGWFLGPEMQCVSDSFRNYAAAYSAQYANRPGNTTRAFQYGRSMSPGRVYSITDRSNFSVPDINTEAVMVSTTDDRIGGPNFYVDEDNVLGRNRQIFVMRQEVRRGTSGIYTGWNITTRIYGPGAVLSENTAFLREIDDSGREIICGACGIGFQDMDERGVGRSDSIIFTDATLRIVSFGDCVPPPDLPCIADWRLTTFKPDNITPQYGTYDGDYLTGSVLEACYYDNRECPRPFLIAPPTPAVFSETEIDFPRGRGTIGQIAVQVLDKRLTRDQGTGIVTAVVNDMVGRRAVLERWREDLGYVTVMDGVIESIEEDQSMAAWTIRIRDPRERERKIPLFERNETFSVYPEVGPIEPYGIFPNPDDGYLIAPVAFDDTEAFQLLTPGPGDQGVHYGYVRLDNVSIEHLERWAYPISFGTVDPQNNLRVFPDITVRWRPLAGSTWTYLRNMPAPFNPAFGSILAGTLVRDNAIMDTTVLATPALFMSSFDAADLPDHNDPIEFQILAAKTTENTPFMWDRGSVGDLAIEIYEGQHSEYPPEFRFSEDQFAEWALETGRARMLLRAPEDDMREFVEESLFAGWGYAPSFDEHMRTIAQAWELPPADEELVELNPDWIVPVGEFTDATESVVNVVKYSYVLESLLPDDSTLLSRTVLGQDQLSPYERLLEQPITAVSVVQASTDLFGEKAIEYKPATVRGFAGLSAALSSQLSGAQTAHDLVDRITTMVLDRFAWGAAQYSCEIRSGMGHGPTFDPYTLDLRVGQWVKARVDWLPNYVTGERNLFRYMQIVSITDPDIARRRIRLVDGGPVVEESLEGLSDDPDVLPYLQPPEIGTLVEGADLRVEVPITVWTDGPADTRARVDYAIGPSEPASTSGDWRLIGALTADGSIFTPPLPAGSTVWIRARSEAAGRRPSAWTPSESIVLSDVPALLSKGLTFADDTGLVQLAWVPNSFAGGVEIEVSTGAIGHTPTFGPFDELDSGDSPVNLLGEEIGYGEELVARITAWETFSLGSVGGTEGLEYVIKLSRPSPSDTATHEWGAHTDTDFIAPEDRTEGMTGLWSVYDQKFLLGEVPTLPIDIVADTTGTLTVARGGTGLTTLGSALQLLRTNAAATLMEWWTLVVNLATQVTGALPTANGGVPTGGSTGQVLKKTSGSDYAVAWDTDNTGSGGYSEGTSFPGSPSDGDKFYRTDQDILYRYRSTGTRWVSVQQFTHSLAVNSAAVTASVAYYSTNPCWGECDMWAERLRVGNQNQAATPGTNFFTYQLHTEDGASQANLGGTTSGNGDTQNSYLTHEVAIDAVVSSAVDMFRFLATESGAATTLISAVLIYRKIGT